MAASLLDSAISAAVADVDQFDVLDELDQLEQAQSVATPPTDRGRSKRGVDGKCVRSFEVVELKWLLLFSPDEFLDALAMEYGNACNIVLRTTACVYQQVVLGRDCFSGQLI